MAANAKAEAASELPQQTAVKSAHVSTMVDAVIANMPVDGLRAILRPILAAHPGCNATFISAAQKYLHRLTLDSKAVLFVKESATAPIPTPEFHNIQRRIRALVGSGLPFEGLAILTTVVRQSIPLLRESDDSADDWEEFLDIMATVDGDILLALTGLQYALWGTFGPRPMTQPELKIRDDLRRALLECKEEAESSHKDFVFERGFEQLESSHM